jgi:hypothetical protein
MLGISVDAASNTNSISALARNAASSPRLVNLSTVDDACSQLFTSGSIRRTLSVLLLQHVITARCCSKHCQYNTYYHTADFNAHQVITAIKSLAALLSGAEARLSPSIRAYVHSATQQLVQGDMLPVLHRADKKKVTSVT